MCCCRSHNCRQRPSSAQPAATAAAAPAAPRVPTSSAAAIPPGGSAFDAADQILAAARLQQQAGSRCVNMLVLAVLVYVRFSARMHSCALAICLPFPASAEKALCLWVACCAFCDTPPGFRPFPLASRAEQSNTCFVAVGVCPSNFT